MLSKSQYILGKQCLKALMLKKTQPELSENYQNQKKSFLDGQAIGKLAQQLFPDGVEVEFSPNNYSKMFDTTNTLIKEKSPAIYEASFKNESAFVRLDILVKNGSKWDLYEIKNSTHIKNHHQSDIALQWSVVNKQLPLNKAYLIHVNNKYLRNGDLELNKLFLIEDVTLETMNSEIKTSTDLELMSNINFKSFNSSNIKIGMQCSKPYPCEFKNHCWKNVPKDSIHSLYRMRTNKKFDLFNDGIELISEIPTAVDLNPIQTVQKQTSNTNKPFINKKVVKRFIKKGVYPLHFFDFESFMEAVPNFDGQRPFEQIPFQYSLHIVHKNGEVEHKEFLGCENKDPRFDIAKQMLNDIKSSGSIVAFNQSFEVARIKDLAKFNSELECDLLALNERFIDLIEPFRKLGYYHPDFNGSFSIKSILPAMFPNDESLNYSNLNVQDGEMAMSVYLELRNVLNDKQRSLIRADLLEYCKLDTKAMIEIWNELISILRDS